MAVTRVAVRVKLRKGVGTLTVSFAYKKQHGESSSEKPPSSRDAGLVLLESPCDLVATLENKMIYAVMDGKASEVSSAEACDSSPSPSPSPPSPSSQAHLNSWALGRGCSPIPSMLSVPFR